MSVILDVLKKLDREKPSLRDHPPDVALEILRPDLPRSKKRIPLQMIIVSLTAIVTAVITYVSMRELGSLSKPLLPDPASPPGPSRRFEPPAPLPTLPKKSPSPPAVISPVPDQPIVPVPIQSDPIRETKEEISKIVPKTDVVLDRKTFEAPEIPIDIKPRSLLPEEIKTDQSVIPVSKEFIPVEPSKKGIEKPVSKPAAGPPSLTVSAIVWYDDASMRFAIINGLKAFEGDFVEGVKVVEINRTSVRFMHHDKHFEISISR